MTPSLLSEEGVAAAAAQYASPRMSHDLLAPPKLAVRMYAFLVACITGIAVVCGLVMAIRGTISFGTLGWRVGIVVVLDLVLVWGYSRLFRYSLRARPERMAIVHSIVSVMGFLAFYAAIGVMARGSSLGDAASAMVVW